MRFNTRILSVASAAALAATLGACTSYNPDYSAQNFPERGSAPRTYPGAYPNQQVYPGAYPNQQVGYVEYGRITNVALISSGTRPGNSAAGTVIGAVAGGLLGNQIGSGSGRAAATILGAVGGAAVGNRIAGGGPSGSYANSEGPVYRVSVQTDAGMLRTYDVSATGDLRPGDRVRIENGVIYLS